MKKQLPKNWVNVSLKEVTKNVKGKKPKIQSEVEFKGSVPYMDIKALEYNEIRQYADVESSKLFEEGDVAMVWDGARSGWVSKTNFGAIGSTLVAFKPILLNSNYLFYYLSEKYPFINSNARGVGIPHVDPTVLWSLDFPLPALAEQNRIVAKLDSLFAQLETIKTSMATIPVLLKNLRQQILTQAVTGKLTENWRVGKSLNVVKTLDGIEIKRNKLVSKRDNKEVGFENPTKILIPKEWKDLNLWDLSYIVTSGSRDWSKYYSDIGAFFVRSAEINNNKLRLDEAIKVNLPEKIEGKRSLIEKGNLLITITGANVGKCALIEEEIPESYVSQSVAIVKIVDPNISKYIHLTLLSRNSEGSQLENMAYGMGRPVLSLPQIKSVKVPFPSIQEQQEIVSRVESLFAKADAIELQYKILKQKIETLPQSILHKAFKGELVEQLDTDGHAKELLQQIQELKSGTKKKSK